MKKIGLIGGMSWQSSQLYYQIINNKINKSLGNSASAECIMYSVNFDEIAELQRTNRWDLLENKMILIAKKLELCGAESIVLCSNTMHKVATAVEKQITIPLIHIADSVALEIQSKNIKKVALIGTQFTMQENFLISRYENKFNLEIIVPDLSDQQIINDIIYNELVVGLMLESSKTKLLKIIDKLVHSGTEGVIAGCTEIELLIQSKDINVPLFESAKIHAESAAEFALR